MGDPISMSNRLETVGSPRPGKVHTVIAEANQLFREGLQRLLEPSRFSVQAQTISLLAAAPMLEDGGNVQMIVFDFVDDPY